MPSIAPKSDPSKPLLLGVHPVVGADVLVAGEAGADVDELELSVILGVGVGVAPPVLPHMGWSGPAPQVAPAKVGCPLQKLLAALAVVHI